MEAVGTVTTSEVKRMPTEPRISIAERNSKLMNKYSPFKKAVEQLHGYNNS